MPMRNIYAPQSGARSGPPLVRTPSHRQRIARGRWTVLGGMLGLALAGAVVGALAERRTPPVSESGPETGPFSYFPYQ